MQKIINLLLRLSRTNDLVTNNPTYTRILSLVPGDNFTILSYSRMGNVI